MKRENVYLDLLNTTIMERFPSSGFVTKEVSDGRVHHLYLMKEDLCVASETYFNGDINLLRQRFVMNILSKGLMACNG